MNSLNPFASDEAFFDLFIEDGALFSVVDLTEPLSESYQELLGLESLDENALAGLPHVIAKKAARANNAGEHSEVEHHQIKSHSHLQTTLDNAMKAGHTAVIHHNGKPVVAVHSETNYGGSRAVYGVQHADKKEPETHTTTHHVEGTGVWSARQRRHIPSEYRKQTHTDFTKTDAVARVHSLLGHKTGSDPTEKDHYKKHDVSVKVIKGDAHRDALHAARKEAKKGVGGTMEHEAESAARKLVAKHGADASSPKKKADEIHSNIKKAIESGDHKAVVRHAEELSDHVRRHGLDKENHNVSRIISTAKGAHKSGYEAREYSRKMKELKASK